MSEEKEETIGDVITRMRLNEHPEIIKITNEIEALHKTSCKDMNDLEWRIHYQKVADKHFQRRRTYERLAGWPLTSM